jgi:uncharacterized cupin superfamily protein
MQKINLSAVEEKETKSPKGKYHRYSKEISIALGRDPRSLDWMKRHPFDLELTRIPPGAARCPHHAHSAQWELYVVVSGAGKMRHDKGVDAMSGGEVFLFGPNEAHQIINDGREDLIYYVIADNPFGTSCYYPDSKKWFVSQPSDGVILKGNPAEYFDGEE